MKQNLIAFILSMSFVSAQTVPAAQEPSPPASEELPRMIQCQFECVELSHEEATKLLFLRNQSLADATKLRKELQEMVAQNKAKVVDTMMVICQTAQKATTESIMEYTYPTEYSQPSLPGSFGSKRELTPDDIKNLDWLRKPTTPTSFEPRNVGGMLEVEATLDDNYKMIHLRFAWEVVDHQGEKTWMEYKDSMANTYKIEMPIFYTKRVSSNITCTPSTYNLVAMIDPQSEKGVRDTSRKWLIFSKCEIQVVR